MMRRGSRASTSATAPGIMYLSFRASATGEWRGAVISDPNEVNVTPRAATGIGVTTRIWTVVAGVTLVAGAWWLRTPSVGYLAFAIAATVVTAGVAMFE